MLEYLSLIGQAERDDLPLHQRRGMLDILSRITQYMSPEEHARYSAVADQVRQKLAPHLPSGTMLSGVRTSV